MWVWGLNRSATQLIFADFRSRLDRMVHSVVKTRPNPNPKLYEPRATSHEPRAMSHEPRAMSHEPRPTSPSP
ncbi:MAG: hypothetical protein D6765_13530 [Bacteroidetes bacterium]|nr:MAG: hypothetical protein D6765_13530 [Bacteroidota bacterium]